MTLDVHHPNPATDVPGSSVPPVDDHEPQFDTAYDMLQDAPPDPEWVVDKVFVRGGITSVGGFLGAGKSPMLVRCARDILAASDPFGPSTPATFLGFDIVPPNLDFRVAYLTQESEYTFPHVLRAARFHDLLSNDARRRFHIYRWSQNAGIPWDVMVDRVAASLNGNGMLIVDPVLEWTGEFDLGAENDSGTMTGAYLPLVRAADTGLVVVGVTHTPKTFDDRPDDDASIGDFRGSGAVASNSVVALLYKQPKATTQRRDTRYFKVVRTKFGWPSDEPMGMYVRMVDSELHRHTGTAVRTIMDERAQDEQRVVAALSERPGEYLNAEDLARATGRRKSDMVAVAEALHAAGTINRVGTGSRGNARRWGIEVVGPRSEAVRTAIGGA